MSAAAPGRLNFPHRTQTRTSRRDLRQENKKEREPFLDTRRDRQAEGGVKMGEVGYSGLGKRRTVGQVARCWNGKG